MIKPSYNDFAGEFDSLFPDVNRLTQLEGEALDTLLKPYQVHTVLDCACGTGIQSIGLARLGYQVSASDISPRMVRCTQQKASLEGIPIQVQRADFRNLRPWSGQVFDAVICSGNSLTLMRTADEIQKSLRSMLKRARKPGGVVVIGLHNYLVLRDQGQNVLVRHAAAGEASGDLLVDLRFFGTHRARVTYFLISLRGKGWRMKTYTKSYWMMEPGELRQHLVDAGCREVQLFDISGQREYNNDEWALAVGRV